MRFESYAQFLEDLVLHCALKDVDKGFYIDVGANDPTDLSVTKFFYDRGCRRRARISFKQLRKD